jgi:hypothetical protein
MPRNIDEKNRRARRLNPLKSGIRSGNPQLAAHAEGKSAPRQRRRRRLMRTRAGKPSGS